MVLNHRSQYYTRYQQRHADEYSEAARNYRENNRDEINARQRNAHRRNNELSRLHNEDEYLRKTLKMMSKMYQ